MPGGGGYIKGIGEGLRRAAAGERLVPAFLRRQARQTKRASTLSLARALKSSLRPRRIKPKRLDPSESLRAAA
jgi:hypothetical protein